MIWFFQVQALVEKGASRENIGIRKPMPPGFLFAVYDSESGKPEYIPPDANEIQNLLEELILYVSTTDDHFQAGCCRSDSGKSGSGYENC